MDTSEFDDISLHIFQYLPIKDIHSLGLVNKHFQKGYLNELQWKSQLDRDYNGQYTNFNQGSNYKTYKKCHKLVKIRIALHLSTPINTICEMGDLTICNIKLFSLPPEIDQLTNLKSLRLNNIGLHSLPKEFESLTKLETLSLVTDRYKTFPIEICSLTQLRELYLYQNELELLSPEIKYLTNLRIMDLETNELSLLPVEIERLTKLETLNISHNKFKSLPLKIELLTNLQELILYSKEIKLSQHELKKIHELPNINKTITYENNGYRRINMKFDNF